MTETEKAQLFDLLQLKKVIQVRKDRSSGEEVTRIEHGDTRSIVVDRSVISVEAERAARRA